MVIAIIDKFPILRQGLAHYLRESFSGYTIIELDQIASNDKSSVPQDIDLVILGINHNSGIDYILEIVNIKNRLPNSQLIVYDEKIDALMALEYMRFGANGYLAKDNNLALLTECIKDVLSGKKFIVEDLLNQLQKSEMSLKKLTSSLVKVDLTLREYQIAKFLSEGKSTSWIANNLNRKASTISTTKFKIFKKMNVNNIVHLKINLLEIRLKASRFMLGT